MPDKIRVKEEVVSSIAQGEKQIAKLRKRNKVNTETVNQSKLSSYAELAVEIADENRYKRNKKGNFFSTLVSGEIKRQLEDAGVTTSAAKYFYRHAVDLVKELGLSHNSGVAEVYQFYSLQNIDSEAKLRGHFNGDASKSEYDKLLDKAVGRFTKTGAISVSASVLKSEKQIEKFANDCFERLKRYEEQAKAEAKAVAKGDALDKALDQLTLTA